MRGRQPRKSRLCSAELRLIEQVKARTPKPAVPSQQATAVTSVAGKTGDVALTKADVGLSNADNTSDAAKPVSTATQTALDGKAASGHNHDASYAALGHAHTGVYEPANSNIQTHVASAHAPANAQKNSDILKSEIEAVLTGEIGSHTHAGGGASPWTLVKKTADEQRNLNTTLAADGALVVALGAATRYRVYINVMLTTANATMDYKYDLNYTGTVTSIRCKRKHAAAGAVAGTDVENTLASAAIVPSTPVAATTTGVAYVEIEVNVLTLTAGTLQFRWAQNTSDAGLLTVLAGSYLEHAAF